MPQLLMDNEYPVGGATVEWYAWIKGFIANHHQVGVLTFKGANRHVRTDPEFDLVETYDLDEGIPKLRWFTKRYPAIVRAVKRYEPDYLIQECAGYQTGILAHIAKKLQIPFIYRVANDMDADIRHKKVLSFSESLLYQYGLKHASFIICQNSYQHEQLRAKYPSKKMFIIHNPFYAKKLPTIKKLEDRKYLAWIGLFQYQKNLPALLRVAQNLPELEIRIAGIALNMNIDDESKRALEGLRQCSNVKFVGFVKRSAVIPFLSAAVALLNTSYYEGFSNSFLESFLAGTPVITTQSIDPDNIIGKYNLGRIALNYSTIPQLVHSLLADGKYHQITMNCRNYVLKEHNPEILARKFISNLQ